MGAVSALMVGLKGDWLRRDLTGPVLVATRRRRGYDAGR
jgi:hypothetical protein